jgi:hypothetical protein
MDGMGITTIIMTLIRFHRVLQEFYLCCLIVVHWLIYILSFYSTLHLYFCFLLKLFPCSAYLSFFLLLHASTYPRLLSSNHVTVSNLPKYRVQHKSVNWKCITVYCSFNGFYKVISPTEIVQSDLHCYLDI